MDLAGWNVGFRLPRLTHGTARSHPAKQSRGMARRGFRYKQHKLIALAQPDEWRSIRWREEREVG